MVAEHLPLTLGPRLPPRIEQILAPLYITPFCHARKASTPSRKALASIPLIELTRPFCHARRASNPSYRPSSRRKYLIKKSADIPFFFRNLYR